ncbi:MAG TPA: hypothetical protein DEQ26_07785 [Flavobacteriaceae bacterium]|nr:hypothetical protein [Flavobacteriaceae bacterium]
MFEYGLYARMKNFICIVCIKIYENEILGSEIDLSLLKENRIYHAYLDLLRNLEMLEESSEIYSRIKLKEIYVGKNRKLSSIWQDYHYVKDLLSQPELFKTPISRYIKFLIRYIIELENISLLNKTEASLSDDFYSDLGEEAFSLFNSKNYTLALKDCISQRILDVGCGNGNFIDYFIINNGFTNIVGIEKQEIVCEHIKNKYSEFPNIRIIQGDVMDIELNERFDLVNMSYMLFYLSHNEQKRLFEKLYYLLDDSGQIVFCQYFPHIESIQIEIAKQYSNWNYVDKYKFSISQNILYAEVLLNESLMVFKNAVRFPEFLLLLSETGFCIRQIYPADNNFYSFYFCLSKKGRGELDDSSGKSA